MKKVLAILLAAIALISLVGCGVASSDSDDNNASPVYNKEIFDFVRGYDRAIIKLANDEVVEVKIKKWTDYDGEQLQITAEDGTVYLTSSFRCDLIKDN